MDGVRDTALVGMLRLSAALLKCSLLVGAMASPESLCSDVLSGAVGGSGGLSQGLLPEKEKRLSRLPIDLSIPFS